MAPLSEPRAATGVCRAQILLLEDDDAMRALVAEVLHAHGYRVEAFPDGMAWLEWLLDTLDAGEPADRWQVIVSDVRMPELNGLAALRFAKLHLHRLPPVILITGFSDDETHAGAQRLGAAAVFDKPFEMDTLVAKVDELVAL